MESLFHDINMGYISPGSPEYQPGDTVAWWGKENSFNHIWSLEYKLENYGYYRQDEIFKDPITFLHTPADLVDMITTNIGKGSTRRLSDEERILKARREREKKD